MGSRREGNEGHERDRQTDRLVPRMEKEASHEATCDYFMCETGCGQTGRLWQGMGPGGPAACRHGRVEDTTVNLEMYRLFRKGPCKGSPVLQFHDWNGHEGRKSKIRREA